jgi:hypothetical protein
MDSIALCLLIQKLQFQQLSHGRLRGDREKPYKQVIS